MSVNGTQRYVLLHRLARRDGRGESNSFTTEPKSPRSLHIKVSALPCGTSNGDALTRHGGCSVGYVTLSRHGLSDLFDLIMPRPEHGRRGADVALVIMRERGFNAHFLQHGGGMRNSAALGPGGGGVIGGMSHRTIHGADLRRKLGTDWHRGEAIGRAALPLHVCAGTTSADGTGRSAGTPLARIPCASVDIDNGHHASPELNATLKRRKSLTRKRIDPVGLDGAQWRNFRRNLQSVTFDRLNPIDSRKHQALHC